MAAELTIEDVPEHIVERLRLRALQNRRTLEEELLAIITATVRAEALDRAVGVIAEDIYRGDRRLYP